MTHFVGGARRLRVLRSDLVLVLQNDDPSNPPDVVRFSEYTQALNDDPSNPPDVARFSEHTQALVKDFDQRMFGNQFATYPHVWQLSVCALALREADVSTCYTFSLARKTSDLVLVLQNDDPSNPPDVARFSEHTQALVKDFGEMTVSDLVLVLQNDDPSSPPDVARFSEHTQALVKDFGEMTVSDLVLVLQNDDPSNPPDVARFSEHTQALVKDFATGSCILEYTDESSELSLTLVGWRGVHSLRAYTATPDTVHYLRLLGADYSKYATSSDSVDETSELSLTLVGWRGVHSLRAYTATPDTVHYLRLLGADYSKYDVNKFKKASEIAEGEAAEPDAMETDAPECSTEENGGNEQDGADISQNGSQDVKTES
ncbi:unnamed protein product [Plutella xylostella]|uniref:(diamondback moth) hypothetical protein n=1 Tax=Plutella xylostella TaxID=51655 RepID=A0A8S4FVW5_PLUXY|nr:unnamed protein product [Plutella xylostella]